MKTKLLIVLTALMTLSLSACSQSNKSKDTKVMNKSKVLVAYFSASGVTRGVAQQLSEAAGADLHEIKPQQPYTDADLDWRDKQSRSTLEMQDKSSRPAIIAKLQNMADYDVVFVGFPIWWYTCPTIINTFMESYDFKGKTVIPFATSGDDLRAAYPAVNWQEGRLLNGATKKDLEAWVKKLEIR